MPTRTLNHRSQLQLWASRPSTPQRSLPTTLARLLLPRQRLLATLTPTPSSSMTTSRHVQHKPPCAQSDLPNSLTAFRVTPGSAFLCATFLLLGQLASRKNDTGRFLFCPAAPSTEKLLACLFLFVLLVKSEHCVRRNHTQRRCRRCRWNPRTIAGIASVYSSRRRIGLSFSALCRSEIIGQCVIMVDRLLRCNNTIEDGISSFNAFYLFARNTFHLFTHVVFLVADH
jgi:hypothetical protein